MKLGWGEFWFIFTGIKKLCLDNLERKEGGGVWEGYPARSLLRKVGGSLGMVRHGEIAQETGVPLCHQLCQGGPS